MANRRLRSALFVAAAMALVAWLSQNLSANLAARGVAIDFRFLWQPTAFPVGESPIAFAPGDTYARAFLVGVLNTIKLAAVAIVLSTILGIVVGLAERASHPQLRSIAKAYVEITRNIPLLLILVVCATAVRALPAARDAWSIGNAAFLSGRGLYLPTVHFDETGRIVAGAAALGLLAVVLLWRRMIRDRRELGHFPRLPTVGLFMALGTLGAVALVGIVSVTPDVPVLAGFNFRGGIGLTPEYIAMLAGLSFYTSGFIAEIVRGSLAAVAKGQSEAAQSLGLSAPLALYLVLAPQALRLMLPPLANQYLNATKNTTLAVLIGYPDLVSVGNTALNQTGRAIETVSIYLLIYLTLSLLTSAVIKRLETRARLVKS